METKPRLWERLCTLSDVILGKSIPFLDSVSLSVIMTIIITTFEGNLLCILPCTKHLTNVTSFDPHSNLTGAGVGINTPSL